jgi:hypothetical protein
MIRNVSFVNGQTDRLALPYTIVEIHLCKQLPIFRSHTYILPVTFDDLCRLLLHNNSWTHFTKQ